MSKYTESPWQGGDGTQTTRLWAHTPLGSLIIADFSVSKNMRHEEQVANARRAKACVRFCDNVSTEEIEALLKSGWSLADMLHKRKP